MGRARPSDPAAQPDLVSGAAARGPAPPGAPLEGALRPVWRPAARRIRADGRRADGCPTGRHAQSLRAVRALQRGVGFWRSEPPARGAAPVCGPIARPTADAAAGKPPPGGADDTGPA